MSEKVQEFKEKKLFEKIEKLEEQIKQNPQDSKLYLELGVLCIDSENYKVYKKGMSAYEKAFCLNPSSDLATMIANLYESDEKMLCTYKYRLKAIKLEPNKLKSYLALCDSLDFYIDLLWEYVPDNKNISQKEEKALDKLERYEAMAIDVAQENLKLEPNNYDLLCILSELYLQRDDDKALSYALRAFEIDKENDNAYYKLGYLYRRKKEFKKLVELYIEAGDYHEAGEIYRCNLRDFNKAIECYYKALESNSENYLYNESLGCTLNYINQPQKALSYLLKARDLKPKDATPYVNLVYVYNDLGNYHEVKKNLNIAYSIDSRDAIILISKLEIELILDNIFNEDVEEKVLEYFSSYKKVMSEYFMLKIIFNITQKKDMKDELLIWKEEYERLSDSYSIVGLENWAKKQDKEIENKLLEALSMFK